MTATDDILDFWFGEPWSPERGAYRKAWFVKDTAFDDTIRARFLDDYEHAATGGYDAWAKTPDGSLALLILLDQFPRNLFRGEARTYATDGKAHAVAEAALARGFDEGPSPCECWFLYLPFEHSEHLEDQYRAVTLFDSLPDDEPNRKAKESARRHLEIIRRFGRFPHRNEILGRPSTAAEIEFLKEANSRF